MGNANDAEQVKRLQRFLNDLEGQKLAVSGVYDVATLAAVHVFQTKYAADILTPWGIKESTGYVYLTTRKKVNEIFCNFTKTFPLAPEEQKKVDEARAKAAAAVSVAAPTKPKTPSVPTAPSVKDNANDGAEAVAATATDVGAVKSVLDFLKGLFGR